MNCKFMSTNTMCRAFLIHCDFHTGIKSKLLNKFRMHHRNFNFNLSRNPLIYISNSNETFIHGFFLLLFFVIFARAYIEFKVSNSISLSNSISNIWFRACNWFFFFVELLSNNILKNRKKKNLTLNLFSMFTKNCNI